MKSHVVQGHLRMGQPREVTRTLVILCVTTLLLVNHVVNAVDGLNIEHELRVVADNPVDLPCDYDLDECGPIHSVKFYKDRNRVFSYHNNTQPPSTKPLGDLASPKGRVTFDIDKSPNKLHITSVVLLDEGLYLCEVTYKLAQENCKTITITSLTTMSKPEAPEIRLAESPVIGNRIGPIVENTTVTLICESRGGKPVARVTWWNSSELMSGEGESFEDVDETALGYNSISITISRADLNSRFECQAINEAVKEPLTNWVEVDVYVSPLSVEVDGPDLFVGEDETVTIKCVAIGALPAAKLLWFNDTKEVEADKYDQTVVAEDGETFTTRSELTFKAKSYDDNQKIRCIAQNEATGDEGGPEDHYMMDVHYAPIVSISPLGSVTVNYSGSYQMFCHYEANPMKISSVVWFRNGHPITLKHAKDESDEKNGDDDSDDEDNDDSPEDYDTDVRIIMSMGSFYEAPDDSSDNGDDDDDDDNNNNNNNNNKDDDDDDIQYPSLLIKHVLHVDIGVYTCKVTNTLGSGYTTSAVNLNVFYPPVTKVRMEPKDVREDENANVTLTCEVIKANPNVTDRYKWVRDGVAFDESEDNEFVLPEVTRKHSATYACLGRNELGWGFKSKPKPLMVKYPPGPAKLSYDPMIVVKGNEIILTCTVEDLGQPPNVVYRWHRGDMRIAHTSGKTFRENVTLNTLSNFSCAADNGVAEGDEATISINVNAAPSFIESLPPTYGVLYNASDVSLSCHVECSPRCEIAWFRNRERIFEPNKRYTLKTVYLTTDYKNNKLPSVLSTLTWNLDSWPDGKLRRGVDDAEYTCRSTENFVGPGVSDTTVFQVHFPPEDIELSDTVIQVFVGDIPPPVICKADGQPAPKYQWKFGDELISDTNTLNLNYSMEKDHHGEYTCVAYNNYGNETENVLIDVLYEPECEIDKEMIPGGKIVITCTVSANPTEVDFEWEKDDVNITERITVDGLVSTIQFQEAEEHFGIYTCSGGNSVGRMKEECQIEVTGKGGWLETVAENKSIFVAAAVITSILLSLLIIGIIICILRKRAAAKGDDKGDPDSRAFYENLPFHGLQPPPNKPFRPVLPDLEYADVDFPAQPLNNNQPQSKAKIVEKILEDADTESPSTETPVRPPRSKDTARK